MTHPKVSHCVDIQGLLNKGVWSIHELLSSHNSSVVYKNADITHFPFHLQSAKENILCNGILMYQNIPNITVMYSKCFSAGKHNCCLYVHMLKRRKYYNTHANVLVKSVDMYNTNMRFFQETYLVSHPVNFILVTAVTQIVVHSGTALFQ